jgi:hypothetical protein
MRVAALVAAGLIIIACGSSRDGFPARPPSADGGSDSGVCDAKHVCRDTCCAATEVCSFLRCVTPGAACVDSSDCPEGQYCDYLFDTTIDAGSTNASCVGGATQRSGRCLPRPPLCPPDAGASSRPADGTGPCLAKCESRPPPGVLTPTVKYAWGGQVASPFATDVMMTPIVVQLDDDNCDGRVTAEDIPEILFTSFSEGKYTGVGTLHAISIIRGALVEKWSRPNEVAAGSQLAGGNIDGKPGNEVVACTVDGHMRAYNGTGTPLWTSDDVECGGPPSLADLDGDGTVEIIAGGFVVDGPTGKLKRSLPVSGDSVVSDIDGDGKLDVVTGAQAFDANGTLLVDTGVPGNFAAIGDFDGDGKPEIVGVDYANHRAMIWHYDAAAPAKFSWVRPAIDINGQLLQHCGELTSGYTKGGGPPTVADFDGDGKADVALAGGIGYTVLSGAKIVDPQVAPENTILWAKPTTDCSSAATGSSVFDFDGDGKAEVVYSDENHLRIYEGPTGNVLFEACNTTGTLVEYPVIADVDNDGHADIVVVSNSYANGDPEYQCNDGTNLSQSGVRVFGDSQGSWVRTRRIWNQHAYHITNVNEDGSIPQHELPNWKQPGLNNFRQNKAPGNEFSAPDAIVTLLRPDCDGTYALVATVTNIGEAALPAGIVIGFYAGTPPSATRLGGVPTQRVLLAAQSEDVILQLPSPPPGVKEGGVPLYAVVDDGSPAHPSWRECRVDNNTSTSESGSCSRSIH